MINKSAMAIDDAELDMVVGGADFSDLPPVFAAILAPLMPFLYAEKIVEWIENILSRDKGSGSTEIPMAQVSNAEYHPLP